MRWLIVVVTVLTVLALPFTGRVLWVTLGLMSLRQRWAWRRS